MVTLITIVHVFVCLFLILTILLQAGKGGGMGAAFGGAGTQTVFGGRGAATFLGKLTTVMAIVFVGTSMLLAYWASQHEDKTLRLRSQSAQHQTVPNDKGKSGLGVQNANTKQSNPPATKGTKPEENKKSEETPTTSGGATPGTSDNNSANAPSPEGKAVPVKAVQASDNAKPAPTTTPESKGGETKASAAPAKPLTEKPAAVAKPEKPNKPVKTAPVEEPKAEEPNKPIKTAPVEEPKPPSPPAAQSEQP